MVLSPEDPELDGRPVIRVANPRAAFAALLELFRPQEEVERVISPYAYVSKKAKSAAMLLFSPLLLLRMMPKSATAA